MRRVGILMLVVLGALLIGGNVRAATPTPPAHAIWTPAPTTSWQWQLSGLPLDTTVDVQMYDVDLFDTDASTVTSLHAQGRHVVCYLNAGAWEDWRPDAGQFPAAVRGNELSGWPGERWLDIRRLDVLGPLVQARLDLCQDKGFDAVEADNVDGYANDSGFILSYQDQLAYNTFLANEAHARGLAIALKNDMSQAVDLLPYFDFAINEECFYYGECNTLAPFTAAGKAVFNVEYELEPAAFCEQANALGFNSLKKHLSLDGWRVACRRGGTSTPVPPTTTPRPTLTPTNCVNPFTDLGGNIFYPAIHTLYCRAVVSGSDATHFMPTAGATRAQFAKVVALAFGLVAATNGIPSFSDVPTDYYAYPYIEAGRAAGIIGGYSAAQCAAAGVAHPCFLPNRRIRRGELTKLVIAAAGYTLITPPAPSFADVSPGYFAYAYIETARTHGVISGVDGSHFAPDRDIRRDEMCQIVYRATHE